MLAVMTLLVVSMIKTSVVELKIGGANQIALQNLTNAERTINSFIDANNGRFAANYLPLPFASGGPQLPTGASTGAYSSTTTSYTIAPHNVYGGQADIEVLQIQCTSPRQTGTGIGVLQFVYFDVRSTATGTLGGRTTVHQGIRSQVPAGAC
jgi:predicted ThiF/HesA family dinucleotide-utilizing enzyme